MNVRRGDIFRLGNVHLMCGDATDPQDVQRLLAGAVPDLVFTSPPYLQQRAYHTVIGDWDRLMQGVFAALTAHEFTQVLVNLGLVHQEGEWLPYWDEWIAWMRKEGWRRYGFYVWDKLAGAPGNYAGRPAPCHEFIFHFNKNTVAINKTAKCLTSGRSTFKPYGNNSLKASGMDRSSGFLSPGAKTGPHKIPDTVFRFHAARTAGKVESAHPAVFPSALAAAVIEAWSRRGQSVYEPFCGSGTTLVAARYTHRVVYGMEISPEYTELALRRLAQ